MRPLLINIYVWNVHHCDGNWWVTVLGVEWESWSGALLHVERTMGAWMFDFLWLGDLIDRLRGKFA